MTRQIAMHILLMHCIVHQEPRNSPVTYTQIPLDNHPTIVKYGKFKASLLQPNMLMLHLCLTRQQDMNMSNHSNAQTVSFPIRGSSSAWTAAASTSSSVLIVCPYGNANGFIHLYCLLGSLPGTTSVDLTIPVPSIS